MHVLTKTPREMESFVLKWARADHDCVMRSRPDDEQEPFDLSTVPQVEAGGTYVPGFLFAARPMIAADRYKPRRRRQHRRARGLQSESIRSWS